MVSLIKKSKGLKTKFIDNTKFKISAFEGDLAKRSTTIIPKMFKGIQKARRDYKEEIKDLPQEIETAPKELWGEIVKESKSLGIDLIGFAPVDENLIFEKDYTNNIEFLYENGIVLGMEMDFDAINTAPNPPAGLESLRIYRAIAFHPLGGPILYPAMAVKANLGKIGSQGLLITKNLVQGKDYP